METTKLLDLDHVKAALFELNPEFKFIAPLEKERNKSPKAGSDVLYRCLSTRQYVAVMRRAVELQSFANTN